VIEIYEGSHTASFFENGKRRRSAFDDRCRRHEMAMTHEKWIITAQGRLFAKSWAYEKNAGCGKAPIVLLHDSLGSVAVWRHFPERLSHATGRGVIAYDRLGFGKSDPHDGDLSGDFIRREARESFPAVREQFGFESFVAFGHSVGGGMAVACAGHFPMHCRALVTVSAQAFVEDRTINGILEAKRLFARQHQLERLKKYHGDKAPWVLRAWIDTWLSPDFASWSLDADLPRVRCPVLVVHGENDEYGSIRHAERIGSLTSGPSVIRILPECGHIPHREKQDIVIHAVKTFLDA
jgi:pimeloyl-ACP methyl ester carboxylesterase